MTIDDNITEFSMNVNQTPRTTCFLYKGSTDNKVTISFLS